PSRSAPRRRSGRSTAARRRRGGRASNERLPARRGTLRTDVTTVIRRIVLWVTGLAFVRRFVIEHPVGQRLAGRLVAGGLLDHGIRATEELDGLRVGAMLDHLGENVQTRA